LGLKGGRIETEKIRRLKGERVKRIRADRKSRGQSAYGIM
jgi:hypothetical protein